MSKPSVEEIVKLIEARKSEGVIAIAIIVDEIVPLISSWRERGEALTEIGKQKTSDELSADEHRWADYVFAYDAAIVRARAALAAEPASGEAGEHRWIWPDHMLRAPPPPPTQIGAITDAEVIAALRQRADEATRAEAEAILEIAERLWPEADDLLDAIRQRADEASPPPPTQGEEIMPILNDDGEVVGSVVAEGRVEPEGEEETAAEKIMAQTELRLGPHVAGLMMDADEMRSIFAALRQRADEATRAENETCAQRAWQYADEHPEELETARNIAAAIRARIAPKGQP